MMKFPRVRASLTGGRRPKASGALEDADAAAFEVEEIDWIGFREEGLGI